MMIGCIFWNVRNILSAYEYHSTYFHTAGSHAVWPFSSDPPLRHRRSRGKPPLPALPRPSLACNSFRRANGAAWPLPLQLLTLPAKAILPYSISRSLSRARISALQSASAGLLYLAGGLVPLRLIMPSYCFQLSSLESFNLLFLRFDPFFFNLDAKQLRRNISTNVLILQGFEGNFCERMVFAPPTNR